MKVRHQLEHVEGGGGGVIRRERGGGGVQTYRSLVVNMLVKGWP